jgi:release factor glutamine methyltransferase
VTRGEAVRAAAAALREAGVAEADLDARVLALEAFGVDLAKLVAGAREPAPSDAIAALAALVARRAAGVPVARILGRREFWGLPFTLGPAALVPRPDTETVVEAALAAVGPSQRALSMLDLGVGSGCLLLAILSERPAAVGVGVDRSEAAVATARGNAAALGLGGRARFMVGDWGAALDAPFDLVTSNPPYIRRGDMPGLDREVRDHDPAAALDGGPDGLDAYRAIVADLPRLLAPDGVAALELGAGQADDVAARGGDGGRVVERVAPDLAGVARAIVLRQGRRSSRRR